MSEAEKAILGGLSFEWFSTGTSYSCAVIQRSAGGGWVVRAGGPTLESACRKLASEFERVRESARADRSGDNEGD